VVPIICFISELKVKVSDVVSPFSVIGFIVTIMLHCCLTFTYVLALYCRCSSEEGSLDNKGREIRSPCAFNKPGGFVVLI